MTSSFASETGTAPGPDGSKTGLRSAGGARTGDESKPSDPHGLFSLRLGLLLLVCLVPRLVVAWRLSSVCDDGYSYLHVADSLQRGRFDQALEYLNLNVYPVVLMGLHQLGLEWTTAGKLWGVLIGTAIAIPLFDWLRRMFDERIATAGVFLYAVHPKLIEYSVEPIREATFWFFFVLAVDWLWRSFEDRRLWQFCVAGLALALALHTRIEGWFLLAPFVVWGAVSWFRAPAARLRLSLGVLLCAAMTPLLLVVMNVTLLAHHPKWEFGRLSPFIVVGDWIRSRTTHGQPSTATAARQPASSTGQSPARTFPVPPPQPPAATAGDVTSASSATSPAETKTGTAALARKYLIEIVRTVGIPFLALGLIGFWFSLGSIRDPRVALLPAWTAAILVAIAIQLVHAGEMNGRYFLTLAFVDAGFAAAGCLSVIRWLQTAVLQPTNRVNRLVGAALVPACLLAAGWGQSFSARHTGRHREQKLGLWAKKQIAPVHRAVCDFQAIRPAYFAAGAMPEVVRYDQFFDTDFDKRPPDLLVVDPRSFSPRHLPYFLERATDLGLVPLDQHNYSSAPPKYLIYVRPSNVQSATGIARAPNPSARN